MNKVFKSAVLTIAAVPFLMAAPAAKKAQPQAANQVQSTKKATKKNVKKAKKAPAAQNNAAAPASSAPAK